MTRDDALLWLTDRCGRSVSVEVRFDIGDYSTAVVTAEGTLRHWSDDALRRSLRALSVPRDDLVGWFTVGDDGASLNITQLSDRPFEITPVGKLRIELAEGVWLTFVEQTEAAS